MHQTAAWAAQPFAVSCTNDAIARLLADKLPHRELIVREHESFPMQFFLGIAPVAPPGVKWPECIANTVGCAIIDAVQPLLEEADKDTYTLDHAARLRLAATLLWLREHPGGSIAERFAHRPSELRSPNHNSGFDAKRSVLYVENLNQSSDKEKSSRFELPVASSR